MTKGFAQPGDPGASVLPPALAHTDAAVGEPSRNDARLENSGSSPSTPTLPQSQENSFKEDQLPLVLPTRIITYAWGEKYIDELLGVTLPAALAPGNLPYVASAVPCEMIILTQENYFARIMNDPVSARIRELCPLRLIGLDDLVIAPDKYGMALSFALHRGFADLGPAMTDTWLIFLNADFILADGSWRTLLHRLAEGRRLVASPSYCVQQSAVSPILRSLTDHSTHALTIAPRDLAALTLEYRHNTIRGKTANQEAITIRYMDQFYWEVNDSTLIGHQMPIAIIGMRPERYLREPNSYWDHGLMREFCPDAEPFVIGDSDEFLMMELREKDVAAELIVTLRPSFKELGAAMVIWVTPYQRDMAKYPLTLHSADLPANIDEARAKLAEFRDQVMSHAPAFLPSHLGHPQWEYHYRPFQEGRHKFLSQRLGSMTELTPPPAAMSDLDKVWWQLDGIEKGLARGHSAVNVVANERREFTHHAIERLNEAIARRRGELDRANLKELLDLAGDLAGAEAQNDIAGSLTVPTHASALGSAGNESEAAGAREPLPRIINFSEDDSLLLRYARQRVWLERLREIIDRQEHDYIETHQFDDAARLRRLRLEYERLLRRRIKSAAIPRVIVQSGPILESAVQSGAPGAVGPAPLPAAATPGTVGAEKFSLRHHYARARGLIRQYYYQIFGRMPRVTRFHPYWAGLRHLIRIVDAAAQRGAKDVITVVGRSNLADTVADRLPGVHATVALPEVLSGNLSKAFDENVKFDLCICSLGFSDLGDFLSIVDHVIPCMRKHGTIVGLFPNFELGGTMPGAQTLLDLSHAGAIYYAGSPALVRMLRRINQLAILRQRGFFSQIYYACALLTMTPKLRAANTREAAAPEQCPVMPENCTSITIEIDT